MTQLVDKINGLLWGNVFVLFALLSGLYYTLRTKFVQFRSIKLMTKFMLEKNTTETGRSSFQAFALSIAGRVGTGNIAGVATAIAIGGPGAVFWMWMSAILGAGTTVIECTLAQIYKSTEDGEFRGGAQYFIEKGLGKKTFAMMFAISSVVALGFCTPGVQSNAIADAMNVAFGFNKLIIGIIIAIVVAITIFGGVKRISKVAEIVVPVMAIVYILVAMIMIIFNIAEVPKVFSLIFSSAFGAKQAFAGIVGSAITMGVKRGIYSNEAGMGTAAQAAATATTSHPAKQGLVQAFSVYIDTLLVCTATAIMILLTGMYNVEGVVENLPGVQAGPGFVQHAINNFIPGFGSVFVALSLLFFAFTTILGNYYAAETGVAYISTKAKNINKKWLIGALRITTIFAIINFAPKSSGLAWGIADLGIGVMSWLNFIALLLLSKIALKVFNDFEDQYKKTGDAVFEPQKLGITTADAWTQEVTSK